MPDIADQDGFWRMMIELFEIVLHRRGYVVVRRALVHISTIPKVETVPED